MFSPIFSDKIALAHIFFVRDAINYSKNYERVKMLKQHRKRIFSVRFKKKLYEFGYLCQGLFLSSGNFQCRIDLSLLHKK